MTLTLVGARPIVSDMVPELAAKPHRRNRSRHRVRRSGGLEYARATLQRRPVA